MYTSRLVSAGAVALAALLVLPAATRAGEGPGLGIPASPEEIAAWDIDIGPDGAGLLPGRGNAREGAEIFAGLCEACHGPGGQNGMHDRLVGGIGTLASAAPVKTVGSYWPHATTLFDYVRRAMPYFMPQSLSDDEVYALSAYILAENGLIGGDDEMNAETLAKVQMPNRDGFDPFWPPPEE
jgi:cytochrome c